MLEPSDMPNGLNLADAMEKLMAHPEIIELAASVLKPNEKADPSSVSEGSDHAATPQTGEITAPVSTADKTDISAQRHPSGKELDGSIALLIALKPYLSKKRCETIDRLIEFGKIGRVILELQ